MSFERGFVIGALVGTFLHWCLVHWRGVLVVLGLLLLVATCGEHLTKSHVLDVQQAGITIRNVGWNRDLEDAFAYNKRIVVEIKNPSDFTLTRYSGSCNNSQFEFSDDAPISPHSTVVRTLEYTEYDEFPMPSGIPYNPFDDEGYRPCEFTDAGLN